MFCLCTLIYLFVKSLPWPLDIHDSKKYFYYIIFLSQYCASKFLVWIRPIKYLKMFILSFSQEVKLSHNF